MGKSNIGRVFFAGALASLTMANDPGQSMAGETIGSSRGIGDMGQSTPGSKIDTYEAASPFHPYLGKAYMQTYDYISPLMFKDTRFARPAPGQDPHEWPSMDFATVSIGNKDFMIGRILDTSDGPDNMPMMHVISTTGHESRIVGLIYAQTLGIDPESKGKRQIIQAYGNFVQNNAPLEDKRYIFDADTGIFAMMPDPLPATMARPKPRPAYPANDAPEISREKTETAYPTFK